MALFLIVTGLHVGVSFPLSFYSGHLLEHRFQLSTLSLRRLAVALREAKLLAVAFSLALVLGLYWLIWTTGRLVVARGRRGAFFVVSVVLGQLLPVLILPLFYKIEKLDAPELAERIARLAAGTGLSIEGVYRMDLSDETVKANAMLAGLGRTRRVLLGDTLLDGFTPDEIEVIFAHEIGHHVFRHIRKMILAGMVYSAAGFWICDRLLAAAGRPHRAGWTTPRLPVWTLPLVHADSDACSACCWSRCKTAVSRRFERQCDRYALQRTGAESRLSLGLSQAGPAQQGRSRSALARSVPLPQPSADRRAAGDGRGDIRTSHGWKKSGATEDTESTEGRRSFYSVVRLACGFAKRPRPAAFDEFPFATAQFQLRKRVSGLEEQTLRLLHLAKMPQNSMNCLWVLCALCGFPFFAFPSIRVRSVSIRG